ncbi:MAG: hypothetical protein RL594_25 [Bacteroidota bacterium]|jgi:hypothetical protein
MLRVNPTVDGVEISQTYAIANNDDYMVHLVLLTSVLGQLRTLFQMPNDYYRKVLLKILSGVAPDVRRVQDSG